MNHVHTSVPPRAKAAAFLAPLFPVAGGGKAEQSTDRRLSSQQPH